MNEYEYEARLWQVAPKYWGAMLVRKGKGSNHHSYDYAPDLFSDRGKALDWVERRHAWWTGERSKQETVIFP